jgi:hypothetical protein
MSGEKLLVGYCRVQGLAPFDFKLARETIKLNFGFRDAGV